MQAPPNPGGVKRKMVRNQAILAGCSNVGILTVIMIQRTPDSGYACSIALLLDIGNHIAPCIITKRPRLSASRAVPGKQPDQSRNK